jgi:hypothetical protein
METLIEIVILIAVVGFIIYKKKPKWIELIKSKLNK